MLEGDTLTVLLELLVGGTDHSPRTDPATQKQTPPQADLSSAVVQMIHVHFAVVHCLICVTGVLFRETGLFRKVLPSCLSAMPRQGGSGREIDRGDVTMSQSRQRKTGFSRFFNSPPAPTFYVMGNCICLWKSAVYSPLPTKRRISISFGIIQPRNFSRNQHLTCPWLRTHTLNWISPTIKWRPPSTKLSNTTNQISWRKVRRLRQRPTES